ncbi:ROK family protein [Streptomyces sp. NPDC056390]|uniref:ROK family protein n=1 Tax=Streptomyces sp. NPDC056390 TaxID=3345806 RepID=UPI0035DD3F80
MQKERAVGTIEAPVPAALHTVLTLVASRAAASRAELARRSGLARSTVGQQVDELLRRGIVTENVAGQSVRGRPPRALTISPEAGTLAVAFVAPEATGVAVTDLNGELIARDSLALRVESGPDELLAAAADRIRGLLAEHGRDSSLVRQVVVGLPGPVDFGRGCAVRPPIMPGWDGYPVAARMEEHFGAPAIVDNDANLMALGEAERGAGSETPLLCVSVGIGIGTGLVTAEGSVHRGADGAAGDIGHVRVPGHDDALCLCGKTGCLEAIASCRSVLTALDIPEYTADDAAHGIRVLSERLANGDARALHEVARAGAEIGEVVAMLVHAFNPRTLILIGPVAEACDELLASIRAVVYQRALSLATRKLVITTSQLGDRAGLIGAVVLAVQQAFSREGVARLIRSTS